MRDNYKILISKLDEFIRKYYKNLIVRGIIYCVGLLILFFLAVTALEYYAHFDTTIRTILFYLYLATNVLIVGKLIIVPLIHLFKIGRIISHEQAADIIGEHFSDVKDKLLNTLQLKRLENDNNVDLIRAGIDQKIEQLKPVPFKAAIDISKNRRYLKYALPPVIIALVILIASPSIITEPTKRIVNHNVYYEKPLPFELFVKNEKLEAIQQEDFTIDIEVVGEEVPAEVYVAIGNNRFKAIGINPGLFRYTFKNVQKGLKFNLVADKYTSGIYELNVLLKPIILNFEIELDYPDYVDPKIETFENKGDLTIPEGSVVKWKFFTRDTESILFRLHNTLYELKRAGSNTFNYSDTLYRSTYYSVNSQNNQLTNSDSLFYTVNVIEDAWPSIIIEEYRDSIFENRIYFKGGIKDDYGFRKLVFRYNKVAGPDDQAAVKDALAIDINRNLNQQQFYYYFDVTTIETAPGDEIEYYFEVWDNDGVNGSKSSRSHKMYFKIPTEREIIVSTDQRNEEIKEEIDKAIKDLQALKEDINEMNRKLVDKEEITWQEQQQIQDLLNKQQEIQNNIENIQDENIQKALKEEQYREIDEELIAKQKELERLFEEILSDEMKDLFKELQEMMENLDENKIKEMLDKMEMSAEDLEEQLDRSLELFKKLEFEKKLGETIEQLEKLAEEQEELSEETKDSKKDNLEEMLQKQEALNEEFDQTVEALDELREKNDELENPYNMDDSKQQEEQIQQEMNQSSEEIKQSKKGKASESQKNASQGMKSLSQQLSDMMAGMQQEKLGEDINMLREILENLIEVSFNEEDLIEEVAVVNKSNPRYLELIQDQKKIKDDLEMIEDSLVELGKRQVAIKPYVTREIKVIQRSVDKSIEELNNRRVPQAATQQQYVMTSVNNLALMLVEAMQQMQQQMQQMSPGGGGAASCPSPGMGAEPGLGNMKQLQEQLNKQLEQLKKEMGQGMQPGGAMPGGMSGMSEQLARLAAQQEAIRNQMQQYLESMKEQGIGDGGDIKKMIQEMEQTETDLVNKLITNQTLMRQQDILTRLIISEKAEREREEEQKRESKEVKNQKISNPEEIFQYKSIKSQQVELLRTIPPSLTPFYKRKVNEYLYNFED